MPEDLSSTMVSGKKHETTYPETVCVRGDTLSHQSEGVSSLIPRDQSSKVTASGHSEGKGLVLLGA